jgi:hypothetical protein
MAHEALSFYNHPAARIVDTPAENSEYNIDIVINGIEVGSYGLRVLNLTGFIWIYGTGLALPRMTQAIKEFENGRTSKKCN